MQSGNASSAGHAWRKQTRKVQNGCVNNLDELPAQPASICVCIFLVYVSLKNTYSKTKREEAEHNERQWEKRKMCHLRTAKQTEWRFRPIVYTYINIYIVASYFSGTCEKCNNCMHTKAQTFV